MKRPLLRSLVTIGCLLGSACGDDDNRPPVLASLVEVHSGTAERASGKSSWKQASKGDTFRSGDRLRTSSDGSARIEIGKDSLDLGGSTLVTFGERIGIRGEIRPVADEVHLELEIGDITLEAGSLARIDRTEDGDRFELLVGAATLVQSGESFALEAGDSLDIDVGRATVTRLAGDDAGPPESDAGPQDRPSDRTVIAVGKGRIWITPPGAEKRSRVRGESELLPGTVVTVAGRGVANIDRGDQHATLEGPARATIGSEHGELVVLERGRATATATAEDVRIQVDGGAITVRGGPGDGSAAEIHSRRRGTRVSATRGWVELKTEKGDELELGHGESGRVGKRGSLEALDVAPETADASITATDASLHSPGRFADVRLSFSDLCPEEGLVEIARRRRFSPPAQARRGEGGAILRLAPGRHRYRIRCIEGGVVDEEPARTGTLTVDRDRGTRRLARVPPTSTVEADGRKYTVLYQNKLPKVRFRWSDAPAASSYELVVRRQRGRAKSFASETPTVDVRSGALREGDFVFRFESARGASPPTDLSIAFDNAASSGYISAPSVGSSWPKGSVLVKGAALPGWRVRVNGTPLPLDEQHRFRRRLPRPDSGRLSIEFFHPRRGRHIYIRRDRGR